MVRPRSESTTVTGAGQAFAPGGAPIRRGRRCTVRRKRQAARIVDPAGGPELARRHDMTKLHAISLLAAASTAAVSASCAIEPHADVAAAPQSIAIEPHAFGANAPTLLYSPARPLETASYPRLATLALRIHDAATITYLEKNVIVQYQLTYQALSDASGVASVSPIELAVLGPLVPFEPPIRVIRIDPNDPARGLLPRTVYRLKIQLFGRGNLPLGPQSDWFYSVTAGTSTDPSDTLKWGRVDMVLRALDQLGDAEDGLIGAGGTVEPDGTRFVSVDHPRYHTGDELTGWCDWFYRYIGVVVTDGLDGQLASDPVVDGGNLFWNATLNPNNVPNGFRDPLDDGCGSELIDLDGNGVVGDVLMAGCQEHSSSEVALDLDDNRFYSNISTNIYYDAIKSLAQNQAMGNYQAMDIHAGMFLAFDPNGDGSASGAGTVGTVWSIEGNVSDTVKIMHRASDSTTINGFGKLTATMFAP
jgi:hypothetical protein